MPTPTKIWGEDGLITEQPPDAYIEHGFDPKLPLPFKYLNWALYWVTNLFGIEHDVLSTGKHTDVTVDSITTRATGGDVDLRLTADGDWLTTYDYYYGTDPTNTALATAAYWTLPTGSLAGVWTTDNTGIQLDDTKICYLDLTAMIASSRTSNTVLYGLTMRVLDGGGSGTGIYTWTMESRNAATGTTWSTMTSGTFEPNEVATTVTVVSAPGFTMDASTQYRLKIENTGGGSNSVAIYSAIATYKPNRIIAG